MKVLLNVLLTLAIFMNISVANDGLEPKRPLDPNQIILTVDNTLSFDSVFMDDTVANLVQKAKEMDARLPSGDPLYLVLQSPGGSIDAGLELISNLASLNRPVHTITLFAASMGFQTVQGLGQRFILKNGTLMSHKARGGFRGEFPGQLDSRYSHYLKRVNRMNEIAAKRTNGKHDLKSYNNLIENEFWCDGLDCVAEGFADSVISASCDKSLEGTKKTTVEKLMYMEHIVEIVEEKSSCPLNSGALGIKVFVNGESLYHDLDSLLEKKPAQQPVPSGYYYSNSNAASARSNAFTSMSQETIMNIKKIIEAKVEDLLNNRRMKILTY